MNNVPMAYMESIAIHASKKLDVKVMEPKYMVLGAGAIFLAIIVQFILAGYLSNKDKK